MLLTRNHLAAYSYMQPNGCIWVGTKLTFDLKSENGETVVLFTHANWREPVEFMYHCSTKWAYVLLGLKAWLEGGAATPYPGEMKISSWG